MNMIEDFEIKRDRAARQRLAEAFGGFGIKPAVDLDFFASELPDEEALHGLWEHLQELARRRGHSPAEACDALNQIIRAREIYDREVRQQPARRARLNRDLAAIAKVHQAKKILRLLDRRRADPTRGPALLVALWEGAVEAKLARDADHQAKMPRVKIKGKWTNVRGDIELALRSLAEDPVAFAAAARKALDRPKSLKRNWSRRLRELIKHPTPGRFEALLKQADDDEEQKVYLPALRRAARRMSGGSLTVSWPRQVAADPEKIEAVAQGALEFLNLDPKAPGQPRDLAHDRYVTKLGETYRGLTGRELSYNTPWPSSKRGKERYGAGLTFVQLGLRLIDPGASEHQARDCIDQHRKHLKSQEHLASRSSGFGARVARRR